VISGLDQIFLEVNNLEESVSFYHDVLGFEIDSLNNESEPPLVTLRGGTTRITLVQQPETLLKRGRGVHFIFAISDVDHFYETVCERAISPAEPRDEGWGGRFVSIQDPDGYRLFFVQYQAQEEP
jgi:lactoylglutathione lyase